MDFPQEFRDLLSANARVYLFLATSMPDGSPQVTPVWFDMEGDLIRINTNEGRIKDRNMKVRPRVAMVIQDPADPYRYLGIRGEVVEHTTEGADQHINQLSLRYDHKPWTWRPDQRRIIYKIKALHFDCH